jgi:hypothetical protein
MWVVIQYYKYSSSKLNAYNIMGDTYIMEDIIQYFSTILYVNYDRTYGHFIEMML